MRRLAALVVFATAAVAGDAYANDMGFGNFVSPGWYLPVGLNAAYEVSGPLTGGVLGGEVSAVHVNANHYIWFGGYADGGYITGPGAARLSVGPEFGFLCFGIDGGFLDIIDHGTNLAGFTLRPMLAFAFVSVYARWDHTFESGGGDSGQVGVLVKFPIPLQGQGL